MDVESKEEYFIELILCRHARKLLTACCLKDLGKFAAHLDFNLCNWLARERWGGWAEFRSHAFPNGGGSPMYTYVSCLLYDLCHCYG